MSALSESKADSAIGAIVGPIIWGWVHSHAGQTAIQKKGRIFGIPYSVSLKWDSPEVLWLVTQLVGPDTSEL